MSEAGSIPMSVKVQPRRSLLKGHKRPPSVARDTSPPKLAASPGGAVPPAVWGDWIKVKNRKHPAAIGSGDRKS
jgi:hypothetical protein